MKIFPSINFFPVAGSLHLGPNENVHQTLSSPAGACHQASVEMAQNLASQVGGFGVKKQGAWKQKLHRNQLVLI